jgi:hypothetical protein
MTTRILIVICVSFIPSIGGSFSDSSFVHTGGQFIVLYAHMTTRILIVICVSFIPSIHQWYRTTQILWFFILIHICGQFIVLHAQMTICILSVVSLCRFYTIQLLWFFILVFKGRQYTRKYRHNINIFYRNA